jgi:diguanylate cyclase (GGDEF)-like protein
MVRADMIVLARAYDEALDEMLARVQRFGEEGAVIALDIDHFKKINDTYGHAAGDEVLQGIAEVMVSEVRPTDKVFRIGGEEFAVLLASADLAKTAERIREAIKSHRFRFKDLALNVTVSAGLAAATDGLGADKLTEAVDAALYRAKNTGRDRVVVSGQRDKTSQQGVA